MVSRFKEKPYVGSKQRIVPKEERIVVENTHEAIITQELFDSVQAKPRIRTSPPREKRMLSGLVKCGGCKRNMVQYGKFPYALWYRCANFGVVINEQCCQESYREAELNEIAIALVIAFVIKGFLFDIVQVDGDSMKQTLHDGERLIVTKLGYETKQGDIVILDSAYKKREIYYEQKEQQEGKEISKWSKMINYIKLPADLKKKYYVKRVIATEGQTVDIINGKVYVDDKRLEEPYYTGMTSTMVEMPQTVEEGHVFVMGDNRPNSLDSRSPSLGQVPEEAVIGASKLRIWPLSKWGWTK